MIADDRVLVAIVPYPADFERVRTEGWYRIPYRQAPKGLHAEYIAFYFGGRFGPQKWAIHFYATNQGHELVRRIDLLPDEPNHPRASEPYIKIQLGPPRRLARPIVSVRYRRVLFLHTTWDRLQTAVEINDLTLDGSALVDRRFAALHDRPETW